MIKAVTFLNRFEAIRLKGNPDVVMISIYGQEEEPAKVSDKWAEVLRLKFEDVDTSTTGYTTFNSEFANQILDFLEKWQDKVTQVIVHCSGGISRSAAVAFAIHHIYDAKVFSGDILIDPSSYTLYNRLVLSTLIFEYRKCGHAIESEPEGCESANEIHGGSVGV